MRAKKEQMVGARLPESLVADLDMIGQIEEADRSTTLRKLLSRAIAEWKLEHYAQAYGSGSMTMARASEEAGVSIWEMLEYVRERRIPAQYALEDLERDVEVIRKRVGTNAAAD